MGFDCHADELGKFVLELEDEDGEVIDSIELYDLEPNAKLTAVVMVGKEG